MPAISVSIVRHGDEIPWPDVDRATIVHVTDPIGVAVLEGGMQSGKASVAIRAPLPDGRTMIIETSLDGWIAATCAMRGAFPEQFAGGPLAGDLG